MRCTNLHIDSLRNHHHTRIDDLAEGFNIFIGSNGAGKTTIIEALSVAALTKSFTSAPDAVLVLDGSNSYSIDARFLSSNAVPLHVRIEYKAGPPARKTIVVNNDKLRRSSDLIGRIPIVALSPDDKIITGGSPEERRRFLSMVLSQASSIYLEDEIELRKAVKHRNSLLLDAKQKGLPIGAIRPMLAPWTSVVVERSARIMSRRALFIDEFRPFLERVYRQLSAGSETPSLQYCPLGSERPFDRSAFEQLLNSEFQRRETEEVRRGTTLVGAHRDEMLLLIDDHREARKYASQGQHKTLLVSMKLAEFYYLHDATSELPILLLDDIFSELDAERASRTLELISSGDYGQTFITSTTRESFDTLMTFSGNDKIYIVENGEVK